MSMKAFKHGQVAQLWQQHQSSNSSQMKQEALDGLISLYQQIRDSDPDGAQEARRAFVLALIDSPEATSEKRFLHFLAEHVEQEDFAGIEWKDPDQPITFCERLYGFPFDDERVAERLKAHIGNVLRHTLQRFEKQGELEKMFQVLRLSPESSMLSDAEVFRLRNRAYLYEMRRVRNHKRALFAYLGLQVFLVVVAFPLLFVYSENGLLENRIEQVVGVEIKDTERQHFSYTDGLYWSVITAGTVGYGDITPRSGVGKVLAAIHGVMGVLTTGVIAGLILKWITPRSLDL